jgi:hypothetical protein
MYPLVVSGEEVTPVDGSFTDNAKDGTNTNSFSFTSQDLGAADAARYIVVVVCGYLASGNHNLTAMTIGGETASLVIAAGGAANNNARTEMWIAAVPTGTTGTVDVTWDVPVSNCFISVYRLVGINPTAFDTATSTAADDMSVTIDCEAGGFIIAGSQNSNNSTDLTVTWAGVTEDVEDYINDGAIPQTDNNWSSASDGFATAQTGLTVSANWSGSGEHAGVAAAFSPV